MQRAFGKVKDVITVFNFDIIQFGTNCRGHIAGECPFRQVSASGNRGHRFVKGFAQNHEGFGRRGDTGAGDGQNAQADRPAPPDAPCQKTRYFAVP